MGIEGIQENREDDFSFRETPEWEKLKKNSMSYYGKYPNLIEEEFKEEIESGEATFEEILGIESTKMADVQYKMNAKMKSMETQRGKVGLTHREYKDAQFKDRLKELKIAASQGDAEAIRKLSEKDFT